MEVKIGITEKEMEAIVRMRVEINCENEILLEKESLTECEKNRLEHLICVHDFLCRLENLTDNQKIVDLSHIKTLEELFEEIERRKGEVDEETPITPGGVQVTPEALEEHLKMQERMRYRDRERLAIEREGLGIGV